MTEALSAEYGRRIGVREGRPQKYGTQRGSDGKLCRLLDKKMVNQWRQEVGLPPI
ncbi:hypothetical protein [Prevotella sp. kh1p2]|uniref:hypothetical protein n=1 Tax=Prevotella sp. kh1p2 TaxID=1761883 RepID=UPI0015A52651|nr:hypothetical protein [Prevotella sp. kh1p2]